MLMHAVHTLEIRYSLLRCWAERAVYGWLQSHNDLVAGEALYYHSLYLRFTQHRNMVPESSKGGCFTDPEMTGI